MNNFEKTIVTLFAITMIAGALYGCFVAFGGNYFSNAPFQLIIIAIFLIVVIYYVVKALKKMWMVGVIALVMLLQGCNYAKSNQQVLVSSDCGMTWKRINAGDAVPKGGMNMCYMKVVIPNFPMQGDMRFLANLNKVKVMSEIDYDYSITDGLLFIREAKYIGKANADADSQDALDPSAFEGAENRVIDKRIKEVAKSLFLDEDIVDLEQDELEARLEERVNKMLAPLGVKLNFLTLTFLPDTQTRQAIDISTAMRIYRSNNLEEVGKSVMVARAGATQITVENKSEATKPEEE